MTATPSAPHLANWSRLGRLGLILAAFGLRLWDLPRLGLAYDEAATALMARATPLEIIHFHWDAAFEHPPIWVLLMHLWSAWAGQTESALRFLPAMAGTLLVPVLWRLLRLIWPTWPALHWTTALLVAMAPVLVYYSQEARMYSLVVLLAVAITYLSLRTAVHPTSPGTAGLTVAIWFMLGLHYYSALLLGALGLYFAVVWLRDRHTVVGLHALALAYAAGLLPLLLWMGFAPGFRETLEVVLREAGRQQTTWLQFTHELWRDLAFGAIRWTPPVADVGLLLVPFVLAGGVIAIWPRRVRRPLPLDLAGWLVVAIAFLPIAASAIFFRTLSTRYILYVVPFLCTLAGLAIARAWTWRPFAGILALALALVPFAGGLAHYFGPYVKSDYRAMTQALVAQMDPASEMILLEAPRQHLLAKYYLPSGWTFSPVPTIALPDYWPVTAPVIVPEEEDNRIQAYLRDHAGLWILYSSEAEVDRGEFLAKYTTAVAYRRDCTQWLDVRVCHYVSPHAVPPDLTIAPSATFGGELSLENATVSRYPAGRTPANLLLRLDWHALAQPSVDYKVSVRLRDATGTVLAQHDEYPIGTLIPPTAWAAGERKPGYMALPLPASLPPGVYHVEATVYDPLSLQPFPALSADGAASADPLVLAILAVDDKIQLLPAPVAAR